MDTIGKLHEHGYKLFGWCLSCSARYRKDVPAGQNPPASFLVDLPALIAERGADSSSIRMRPVPCPCCGGSDVEMRIIGPDKRR